MKKTLLTFTLLITNLTIAQATIQKEANLKDSTSFNKDIYYGIKTGINFNHFNRSGTDYGFQLGGLIIFESVKTYSFSLGLAYSQIGGKEINKTIFSAPGAPISQRDFLNRAIRMHTAEIPINIHFKHLKSLNNNIRPDLYLGIVYNALIYINERRDELWYSSKTTPVGDQVKTLLNNQNKNVTSSYNTHLFSAILGSNIYFKVAEKVNYFFGFEYRIGLQNVKKTNQSYGGNMKTNQFNIKLGYLFN